MPPSVVGLACPAFLTSLEAADNNPDRTRQIIKLDIPEMRVTTDATIVPLTDESVSMMHTTSSPRRVTDSKVVSEINTAVVSNGGCRMLVVVVLVEEG